MKPTKSQWDTIRKAAHAVIIDLDQGNGSLANLPFIPADEDDLKLYLAGQRMEVTLGETLKFTHEALDRASAEFAAAERVASMVEVTDPTEAQMKELSKDLGIIHNAAIKGQQFKAALALAGAVADIAKQFQS